jgi:hypothetical protein
MKSQAQLILEALRAGETISPIYALNRWGCFRLGARIWDLRHKGYDIENIGDDEGNFARYKLGYPNLIPVLLPAFPAEQNVEQPKLF